ncbi:Uncharacterised protein [Mycobacteroides abscessus]|nr:Uncharacterised protein [Mycobacteroides abscessus]
MGIPDPSPLEITIMSGSIPLCWNAHAGPVRYMPACTSSAMRGTPSVDAVRRSAWPHRAGAGITPPSPRTNSAINEAGAVTPLCGRVTASAAAIANSTPRSPLTPKGLRYSCGYGRKLACGESTTGCLRRPPPELAARAARVHP